MSMDAPARKTLYYTFGNHMHWADMQWLWGYQVLPGSVRDMIRYCETTGAKGNINFEGIGYEKMAVEAPDALTELRAALHSGQIEVVGASYGQPYGLYHGGESNVRQRTYGVRAALRTLGVRPRAFWEEEFDFFPQLPQMLKGVGFEYASLFFQWTWHTPEIPREEVPVIWWEGIDGSRILTATRNALNLHQWPEDFALLLASDELQRMPGAGIVQWLELMPSPDWMCRSELMIPALERLKQDPRFDLHFATLSGYLDAVKEHAIVRQYTLADVFHGLSLGKNGDLFRRLSASAEESLLTAEVMSAVSGLFGRPYPHWDVYPAWELEEGWRELLSAQHHDNDECEGLCGFIGKLSYERSQGLSGGVIERTLRLLGKRAAAEGDVVVFNPLGWKRDAVVETVSGDGPMVVRDIPPLGYRVIRANTPRETAAPVTVNEDGHSITLTRGQLRVAISKADGLITQIHSAEFSEGALAAPLLDLNMRFAGGPEPWAATSVTVTGEKGQPVVNIQRAARSGESGTIAVSLAPDLDAVDIRYQFPAIPRPEPGFGGALKTRYAFAVPEMRLIHDHPYAVSAIEPRGTYLRKYPTGEWMTSPQWFEEVHSPFTALSLLDFASDARGVLLLHDGSQSFLGDANSAEQVLTLYDPWDEDYFVAELWASVRLVPHGQLTHAQRWRMAQEFRRPARVAEGTGPGDSLPGEFGAVWCDAPGVAISAFFRETEESGRGLNACAGAGMGFPYVLRLVELNGEDAMATVHVPGPVAAAFRTNLLGETIEPVVVSPGAAQSASPAEWSAFTLALRPHEIATVYLDLVYGRKMPRNLDDYRYVWATVHRVNDEGGAG